MPSVMSSSPRIFLALLLVSLVPQLAAIPLEDGIKSRLEKLTADHSPGIAVLVARDGKIVYQGGFGWANLDQKLAVTAATQFRIG